MTVHHPPQDRATDSPLPHPRSVARYGDADDGVVMPDNPDWWKRANCHGSVLYPELWATGRDGRIEAARRALVLMHPTRGERVSHITRTICGPCPVRDACLADALEHGWPGIRGGTTEKERKRIRRGDVLIQHGTYPGYQAHARYGIPPCDACREAQREYDRGRKRNAVRCGTNAGYHKHRRNGSNPCDACKQAHADYERRRYQESA